MEYQLYIQKGRAVFTAEGLRCAAPRPDDPRKICHKLLVKWNASHQIAGNFLCERCKQEVEVVLAPPRRDVLEVAS